MVLNVQISLWFNTEAGVLKGSILESLFLIYVSYLYGRPTTNAKTKHVEKGNKTIVLLFKLQNNLPRAPLVIIYK